MMPFTAAFSEMSQQGGSGLFRAEMCECLGGTGRYISVENI